jgi:serine/threonine protein phosphatase PrpC
MLVMPLANLAANILTLGIDAGEMSGTTATLVVIDGFTVTVASVGDSRCILDTHGGMVSLLTVDHRLEENVEERERVTASGGEVSRLNLCGGQQVAL